MRAALNNIITRPGYSKVFEWGRLITIAGSAQILIQAIGLISGILIIRLLPTQEYALYTLANTMLGTLTVLADGGISAGVMAQGGKVWKESDKLGEVIVTGLQLRKKFALMSLIVVTPVLFYLLREHDASWLSSIMIVLSLIPAFFAALSDSLLEVPSKLHQDIGRLQKNQVMVSIMRLVLITLSLFVFPLTAIAIIGNGIPRIIGNIKLKEIAADYADLTQQKSKRVSEELLLMVRRILPGAIYFCVSGQITIWLVSFFGSTKAVAEVGALSRLTVVLNVISTLFSALIIPRFARLGNDKKSLLSKFMQIQAVLTGISIFIVGAVYMFPGEVLLILGHNYQGLNLEVILMTVSSCIAMMGGLSYTLTNARGWVLPPALHIMGNIGVQVLLLALMDLSNTKNVLIYSIIVTLTGFVMLFGFFIYKVIVMKSDEAVKD
ncbi:polysaccharide biosynthesis protein [Desertivirga arenae]|uniref:polysaccharide biosynthesis protein n=1 Tax=Desertivirga arenae TaxID=2810309 RepID=UPI001A96ED21|nr:polysaccharide biosynthesis protein [Pedobacter sp. SYSU D00823]